MHSEARMHVSSPLLSHSMCLSIHVATYILTRGSRGLWCSDSQPYVPTYSFCAKNSNPLIHPRESFIRFPHPFPNLSTIIALNTVRTLNLRQCITSQISFLQKRFNHFRAHLSHRLFEFPSKYTMQTRSKLNRLINKNFHIECTRRVKFTETLKYPVRGKSK